LTQPEKELILQSVITAHRHLPKRACKVNLFIIVLLIYNLVNNAASSSAASNGKMMCE